MGETMAALEGFFNQSYLNLETLRRSGEAMRTPVWFVIDGNSIYIRTIANSGKVKRVRNHPGVRIAPCGREGQLLGKWHPARAREAAGGPGIEAKVDRLLEDKYGDLKRQHSRQAAESGWIYTILEVKLDE